MGRVAAAKGCCVGAGSGLECENTHHGTGTSWAGQEEKEHSVWKRGLEGVGSSG